MAANAVVFCVSIHAPRVGARLINFKAKFYSNLFQFTRPAWGRDAANCCSVSVGSFQFTRPAWGRDSINNGI